MRLIPKRPTVARPNEMSGDKIFKLFWFNVIGMALMLLALYGSYVIQSSLFPRIVQGSGVFLFAMLMTTTAKLYDCIEAVRDTNARYDERCWQYDESSERVVERTAGDPYSSVRNVIQLENGNVCELTHGRPGNKAIRVRVLFTDNRIDAEKVGNFIHWVKTLPDPYDDPDGFTRAKSQSTDHEGFVCEFLSADEPGTDTYSLGRKSLGLSLS